MKQGNENKLIQVVYETVEKFIGDWRNSPYEWESEVDIQTEIAQRLRQAFKDAGKLTLNARYDYIRNGVLQDYSRVCCEPRTYYNDSSGSRYRCLPDIVVYDDIDDPDNPPDAVPEKNWPMLWVCEIKYQTEDNSPQYKEWDIEKIKYLLEQNEAKYGCGLCFNRKQKDARSIKPIEEKNGRLKNYTILLKK